MGLLNRVAVAAIGQHVEWQKYSPRLDALLGQILRDQLRIKVAQPFKSDDHHRFGASQIAAQLGLRGKIGRSRRTNSRWQHQVLTRLRCAAVGQSQLMGQRNKAVQRRHQPVLAQQRVGMLWLLLGQLAGDILQRPVDWRIRCIGGVAEQVDGPGGPVHGPQPLGDHLNLQAGIGSGVSRHQSAPAGADYQQID